MIVETIYVSLLAYFDIWESMLWEVSSLTLRRLCFEKEMVVSKLTLPK